MTPAQAEAYIHLMTRTDTDTFLNTDIVILGRIRTDELARAVLKADENLTLLYATANLVASTTFANRFYSLQADLLNKLVKVEAKLDETNFIPLLPLDFREYEDTMDEATIVTNFSNNEGEAYYSYLNRKLFIWSGTVPAVTSGLRYWYHSHLKYITDMENEDEMDTDDSATELGLPEALHEIWCRGIIIDWKSSREKPIPLNEKELAYKIDLKEALNSARDALMERQVFASTPNETTRWNEGYDL